MALSDRQFQDLKKQLEKRRKQLGEEEYAKFLERANQAVSEEEPMPTDDTGFVGDVGQGVAMSAGKSVLGIGEMGRGIQKFISKGVEKVTGRKNFGLGSEYIFDKGSQSNEALRQTTTPDTTGEKIGAFAGDVAQFALPGTAVTKATKGLGFLKRAGSLVGSDVAVQAVQEGGLSKDSIDTAIVSAIFPVAGKAGQLVKGKLPTGKDVGGRVINSLIKPLLKDFSYGKDPGKAVAEAGITANSLDELATNIRTVRQNTGAQIGELAKTSTTRFNASDSLKSLDTALEEAKKSPRTNSAVIKRLEDLKADILRVGEDGLPTRNISDMSAEELFLLKQDVGDLTRWTGNASDDELVNKALKQVYGNLKEQFVKGVPGTGELSEKYANLKSAEIATEYRDKIASRQNLISLSGTQLGTGAALVSAVVSGGAVGPILIGTTAGATFEAMKTPAFKTRVAAWLASASKEELQDAFTQAPWLRGVLQASLLGEE